LKIISFNEKTILSFEICAGNNHITFPQVTIYSDKESKTITMNRDIESGVCQGGTTIMEYNNISSITAFLATDTPDISIDDPTRHLDSARYAFHGMSNDGQILVEIVSSTPVADQVIDMTIRFTNELGNPVSHVNYSILVKQEGEELLNNPDMHTHDGKTVLETTSRLKSDSPVDVNITLNGIGLPGENISWIGPMDEMITFKVVPEFGALTVMVLIIAIMSIIAISAKSRLGIMARL